MLIGNGHGACAMHKTVDDDDDDDDDVIHSHGMTFRTSCAQTLTHTTHIITICRSMSKSNSWEFVSYLIIIGAFGWFSHRSIFYLTEMVPWKAYHINDLPRSKLILPDSHTTQTQCTCSKPHKIIELSEITGNARSFGLLLFSFSGAEKFEKNISENVIKCVHFFLIALSEKLLKMWAILLVTQRKRHRHTSPVWTCETHINNVRIRLACWRFRLDGAWKLHLSLWINYLPCTNWPFIR